MGERVSGAIAAGRDCSVVSSTCRIIMYNGIWIITKLSTGQASRQPQDGRGGGDWSEQGESWAGREGREGREREGEERECSSSSQQQERAEGRTFREWDFGELMGWRDVI
jgi:hypothetical protein